MWVERHRRRGILRPGATVAPSGPADRLATDTSPEVGLTGVTGVTRVAQLTGPGAINDTASVRVAGTDLGSSFRHDVTWFVFGDTFGSREEGLTGGGGDEWRSNALAWTTDTDPSDGITFGGWATDPESGWALEMIPGEKIDNQEMIKIPTYGFSANGAIYLAFMSVRHWGDPGGWETNYSGFAKSTDDGKAEPGYPVDMSTTFAEAIEGAMKGKSEPAAALTAANASIDKAIQQQGLAGKGPGDN